MEEMEKEMEGEMKGEMKGFSISRCIRLRKAFFCLKKV